MFFKKKYKVETGLPFCFWINTKEQDISKLKQRAYKNMYSGKKYLFEEFIYSNMDDFDNSLLSVVVKKDDYFEDVYFYRIEKRKIIENYKLESKYELTEHIDVVRTEFGQEIKHYNCHIEKESVICKINKEEHLSQSIDEFMKGFTKLRSNMDRYMTILGYLLFVLLILGGVFFGYQNKDIIFQKFFIEDNKSKEITINYDKINKKKEEILLNQVEIKYFKNIIWMGNTYRVRTQKGLIFQIIPKEPDARILLNYIDGSEWISETEFKTTAQGASILRNLLKNS